MDYLSLFKTKNDSLVYKLEMSNITVQKGTNELDLANRQKEVGYLFQDDMIAFMTQSLTEQSNKETSITMETDNKSSGIEDFAPTKDFNKLSAAWTTYANACSQYIDLYDQYQDKLNSSTATLDADHIKKKLKEKVILALNG